MIDYVVALGGRRETMDSYHGGRIETLKLAFCVRGLRCLTPYCGPRWRTAIRPNLASAPRYHCSQWRNPDSF